MANICYAPKGSCKTCPHFRPSSEEPNRYVCYEKIDNERLIEQAKFKIPSLSYKDVIERTIVEVYTCYEKDGKEERFIHFLGYGYCSDAFEDDNKDHRFLEYTFFVAPLQEVLDFGVSEYESEFGCEYKQYIEDCTDDTMVGRYLHYNGGVCPLPISKDKLDINTPDGSYILI